MSAVTWSKARPRRSAHSREVARGDCREPSPGADVAGASRVPEQMWQGRAESRRRCGKGEPSPGADVAGVSRVPAQMWQGRTRAKSHAEIVVHIQCVPTAPRSLGTTGCTSYLQHWMVSVRQARARAHTRTRTHTHIQACTRTRTCTYTHAHAHACTLARTCTHAQARARAHTRARRRHEHTARVPWPACGSAKRKNVQRNEPVGDELGAAHRMHLCATPQSVEVGRGRDGREGGCTSGAVASLPDASRTSDGLRWWRPPCSPNS